MRLYECSSVLAWSGLVLTAAPLAAQARAGTEGTGIVPAVADIVAAPTSELRDVVHRHEQDRAALLRRYDAEYSPARQTRLSDMVRARLLAERLPKDYRARWRF